jgi:hypothetical protein
MLHAFVAAENMPAMLKNAQIITLPRGKRIIQAEFMPVVQIKVYALK